MGQSAARRASITLDLEEDWRIPDEDVNPTFEHVDEYLQMIREVDIPVSVFVVGKTIERYPELIETFRSEVDVEFHLHSYTHDVTKETPFTEELSQGVEAFRSFFDKPPKGYRAPQGNITEREIVTLDEFGFEFDSSIFPSYRPGVYNNLTKPSTPYRPDYTDELVELPISVAPRVRVPITQNYLKLFGSPYHYYLQLRELPDQIVFDSHLQDFFKTEFHDHINFPLKQMMTRNISRADELFVEFVELLRSRGYEFTKISEIAEENP